MFKLHLHGKKHRKANNRKHALYSMLRKDNIKAQITTWAKNSETVKTECNKISKTTKTIYFYVRKNSL